MTGRNRRRRGLRQAAALLLIATSSGCTTVPPAPAPMRTVDVPGIASSACTVVLFAGRGGSPEDFLHHGFIERARAAGLEARFLLADANLAYFLKQTLITRLHDDVIAPLRARGQSCVWLAGISLGATAALLYAAEHPRDIQG